MLINLTIGKFAFKNPFGLGFWLVFSLDLLLGMIPVAGPFCDMVYKANLWNYEALQDYLERRPQQDPSSSSSSPSSHPSTEISWTQMILDFRQLIGSIIAYLPNVIGFLPNLKISRTEDIKRQSWSHSE